MHRIFHVKAHESKYGPHFNEEYAHKAVSHMENEDGSRGPHWSLEETTQCANQYGVRLDEKFNKYDWYVALNMVYSDYYRVIINIVGTNNTKFFVEFAKAWLNDKDVEKGKMWYYYVYVMCDKIRKAESELFERERPRYEDYDDVEAHEAYRRGRSSRGMMGRRSAYLGDRYDYEYSDRYPTEKEDRYSNYPEVEHTRGTRYVRL